MIIVKENLTYILKYTYDHATLHLHTFLDQDKGLS